MLSNKKKRNNSTTSMATNKGLLNEPGENNCFLNSAIQVLWHLDVFRRSFRQLTGHACMGASCIFCALKDIFQQFQYSKDHALPPTVLRSALAETFQQQNRFQLGLMDDAAECFENILNRIHFHIGSTSHEDVCTAPHCIPHQKFGLTLVQQCVCACGATSEPLPFIEMVHYVSATTLCAENEVTTQRYGASATSEMFGGLVRVASGKGDIRNCSSGCGAQTEIRNVLMNCPDVVSIGIVWDTDEPEVKHIIDLVHALGTTLRLAHLFHTVVDDKANNLELYLVGMVCYYGRHYSTFFFHTRLRKWVYFDDAQVSEVGKRWSNVVSKCIKGHHQPLLLLYANPNANQVSVATAPKEVTMLPGYSNFHSRQLIDDPLHELAETDSFSGEGEVPSVADEENSGTESMQLAVTQTPKKSAKTKSPLLSVHRKAHDTPGKKEQKKKKKTKDNYLDKEPTENPRQQIKSSPNTQRHQVVKGSQPASLESATRPDEIRPRKSAFQWNLAADDQTQGNSAKVGHYVEPQPANWTTYQPYNHQLFKETSKNKKAAPFLERGSKENSSRNSLAVKARDSKGMATFCVTAKAPPVQNTSEYRPDAGVPQERTSSPTPSSRPVTQSRVLIGRRSPKGWNSSQSSVSFSSSIGKSSHGEAPSATSKPIEVGDAPTTSKSSQSSTSPSPRFSSRDDRCLALFRDADDLMEQSKAADTIFDYASALQLCLEATKVIESIQSLDGLAEEHLIKARLKHGDCINKSRILQRRRNFRLQSQGSESGGTRSSMAEADRHMLPPANQVLLPTSHVTTSTNHSTPSANQPNMMEANRLPQGKDHHLFGHFEKNETKKNLINFDKPGVTQLQNDVQRMYELQHKSKHNPAYQQPIGMSRNISNTNNSNNKSDGAKDSPVTMTPQGDADGSNAERTKIFVWKSPDNNEENSASTAQKTNQSISLSNLPNNAAKLQRGMVSDSDLSKQARKLSKDNNPSKESSDEEVEKTMKSLEVGSSRRYRSVTPDMQISHNIPSSHPQQRRSKTPSIKKERPMQTIGQRRSSDLKLRPKSAYEMPHGRCSDINMPPSAEPSEKKDGSTPLANSSNPVSPFSFPHPHPSWGSPPVMGPGMPPYYYPDFYKWMQFYGMLSPEQKSMLPVPAGNPANPHFSPMFPNPSNATLTPAMHKAYMDNMKIQLGKNLTNLTESVGRAAPHIRSNNTNIYEASKPKPVGSSNPRLAPNTNLSTRPIQRPIIAGSNPRPSNAPMRRPPVESRPNPLRPRQNDQTTNQKGSDASRDSQASTQSERTSSAGTDADKREGMMKWAEEGKKRTPETTMTPEFRKKLLHDFANRPRKDAKQSVHQNYPETKPHEPSQPSATATQVGNDPGHMCSLCGLVRVPSPAVYCSSCRAYWDRLNPAMNSSRPPASKPS